MHRLVSFHHLPGHRDRCLLRQHVVDSHYFIGDCVRVFVRKLSIDHDRMVRVGWVHVSAHPFSTNSFPAQPIFLRTWVMSCCRPSSGATCSPSCLATTWIRMYQRRTPVSRWKGVSGRQFRWRCAGYLRNTSVLMAGRVTWQACR